MRFYISTKGIKRVTISNAAAKSGGAKSSTPTSKAAIRRFSSRTWFPVLIVIGIVLSFLFVRVAFLVLESASRCNSSLDCMGWSFFDLRDTSLRLSEELTRAMVEAKETNTGSGVQIQSFNELVKEITSNRQDIKAFAITTKAMLSRMEHNVQLARLQQSVYWHLASLGVPKSLHCLCLKLAEEYAVNAMARCRLPPPEYVYRLVDPSYHHVVLLTNNVIAASVVVSSTVQNSGRPEKLVFHVVTDKKTYTSMHAWFALNHIASAVVEVKGLHQYDWSREVNDGVKEMLEINRMIWRHYYDNLEEQDFLHETQKRRVKALSSSSHSLLNHLQIYLAELFPDLKRVVLLDDDVVVQHDISSLWELDLNGKVVGAVVDSCGAERIYGGRRYEEYLNFSHPLISSNFDRDRCAWLFGMNVFDLEAWRRANITESHLKWLKLNLESGLELWQPGFLPPVLLAFDGQLHPIDPSWHVAGLGYYPFKVNADRLEQATVLHFSGPAKPWHEIGFPEVRSLWNQHVNSSNKFVRECSITG